mgnify:FL=1
MILQNKKTSKQSEISEVSPFIYSIENSLDDEVCDQLISLFDLPIMQNHIRSKKDLVVNERNSSLIEPGDDLIKDYAEYDLSAILTSNLTDHKFHEQIIKLDSSLYKSLAKGLGLLSDFLQDKCFNMTKIRERCAGLENAPHVKINDTNDRFNVAFAGDLGYGIQKCGKEYKGYVLHDDYSDKRTLTYMWNLNDNFEEGDTVFTYPNYHLKPKKGALTFFPCTWTHSHIGLAPKDNYKYIATGWMQTSLNENSMGRASGSEDGSRTPMHDWTE